MNNKLINGKQIANDLNEKIKHKIETNNYPRLPKLVVLQVGSNSASDIYVRNKKRACENVGFLFEHIKFEDTISEKEVLSKINDLNNDNTVDGFIVQLPLPKHINEKTVINSISSKKDADGFTPTILGSVMLNDTIIYPATPYGVKTLLDICEIDLIGKNIVIIGRSNIVGKPLANILINASATVTVCNTKTQNIKSITRTADILVVAAGVAKMVDSSWIKDDVIIIDVGTNKIDDKYCGDVDFDDVIKKVSKITPVPGGVGPMTIAMLIQNTFNLFLININQ